MPRRAIETMPAETWLRAVEEEHGRELLALAERALGDRQLAEEVLQDTLLRAWRHAHRYDPDRGSLRTWLFAIARNLVIDRQRAGRSRPGLVGGEDGRDGEGSVDVTADLDRVVDGWQVGDALDRLSPEHREVIVETYYRGASVAQAAERIGIPPGTVKSRLYYGLRSLRVTLEEMGALG